MRFSTAGRRAFLRGLLSLSAVIFLLPARALAALQRPQSKESQASSLLRFFRNQQSARVIGREVLRCVPAEADLERLVDLISSSRPERRARLAKATASELRVLLRRQQLDDFECGRTVRVRGWVLSQTEARLCALAALV